MQLTLSQLRSDRPSGWILGPILDTLFISNLFWPLLLFVQHDAGFDGRSAVQFWQVYYITTPHRWITLVIVLLDRQRLRQQPLVFAGLAVLVATVCIGVRVGTGALTCLLAADYVWNAWHFAAQHHGIYRIYGRMGVTGEIAGIRTEKWLLRGYLLYVILRIAGSTIAFSQLENWALTADWAILLIPAWLLIREAGGFQESTPGRRLYLVSVIGLYTSLLWAVHTQRPALVLSLATASAWFHASEYLCVVGWHVQKRASGLAEEARVLSWLAPRWGVALLIFAAILGSSSWILEHEFLESWLLINLIVAFLHYGYDGIIWKRRR